ncbi:hypothetical protein [Streptomyces sp. G-G2]|uniref:hypothetical protein n=1 Tax=Streptomyces sp. G-G2 TaxID=3046201 RepID=UPI0024BA44B0|nr:hypothetical protein [Streptomyces sp. G-G2]MDJ0382587.1 hypothetical protein [Streptomyces sp. G-G2]
MARSGTRRRTTAPGRWLLGALGLLLIAVGLRQVVALPDPLSVLIWLGGGLVLHDGLIAPLVLAVGLLGAAAFAAGPARGLVRGALLTGGALTLITLPLLLRPGAAPNPSALPLPYGRNLLIVLGAVLLLTLAAAGFLAARRRARARDTPDTRDAPDHN